MPLLDRYRRVRSSTLELVAPLSSEDMTVQSMDDVSPSKWHLAHTSWFFEVFVLRHLLKSKPLGELGYEEIFNSYYNGIGPQYDRPSRGLLTRPGLDEVLEYRERVDAALETALASGDGGPDLVRLVELGLNHEQQHQELLLTDIQHVLSRNPLEPRYHEPLRPERMPADPLAWHGFEGGVVEVGHRGEGFAYDNEGPAHRTCLQDYELADRLVTNGEVRAFIDDGGYRRPELWHDEGWALVNAEQWTAPLYWIERADGWWQHSLSGTHPLRDEDPAVHLSWFEASAFACWMDARLPTEFEWEHAAREHSVSGNFRERGLLEPTPPEPSAADRGPRQLYGDAWEWTSSSYAPYPRYRTPAGAIGEYNSKFMVNQYVLRGGSCASSSDHLRSTYRNFFPTKARWQFSGLRLARDAGRAR